MPNFFRYHKKTYIPYLYFCDGLVRVKMIPAVGDLTGV